MILNSGLSSDVCHPRRQQLSVNSKLIMTGVHIILKIFCLFPPLENFSFISAQRQSIPGFEIGSNQFKSAESQFTRRGRSSIVLRSEPESAENFQRKL